MTWTIKCEKCGTQRVWNKPCANCNAKNNLPADYEPCGMCGFDHAYEQQAARNWHFKNPE